jgi:hypothetical protein
MVRSLMKLVALMVLLAACKGGGHARSQPGSAAPPGSTAPAGSAAAAGSAARLDICDIALTALDKTTCDAPDSAKNLQSAKKTFQGILDTAHQTRPSDPRPLQMMCAQLFLAMQRDVVKLHCTTGATDDQRATIAAALDAWYAQRTPVAPTGDPASDAVIARVAAVRDHMCACTDMACLERVDKELDTMGSLPASAPAQAKELGGALLDDVGRCESKIRSAAGS